jgi:hypothetical protein
MSDEEIAELAGTIKTHGLREKIQALTDVKEDATHWVVLDGRNRLEALRRHMELSDVEIIDKYMVQVQLGKLHATPEEYVMMANIERRNLTQAQRRDLAGKLALMISEAQKHKPKAEQIDATAEAAKKAGVSRRTAATAKQQVTAKKPEQQGTTPATPAKTPPPPAAGRPAVIIVKLKSILEVIKDFTAMGKWDGEQVLECEKLAKDVSTLFTLEVERRAHEMQEAARKLLAAVEDEGHSPGEGDQADPDDETQ